MYPSKTNLQLSMCLGAMYETWNMHTYTPQHAKVQKKTTALQLSFYGKASHFNVKVSEKWLSIASHTPAFNHTDLTYGICRPEGVVLLWKVTRNGYIGKVQINKTQAEWHGDGQTLDIQYFVRIVEEVKISAIIFMILRGMARKNRNREASEAIFCFTFTQKWTVPFINV